MQKKWEVMQRQLQFPRSLQKDFLLQTTSPAKLSTSGPALGSSRGKGLTQHGRGHRRGQRWPWQSLAGEAPGVGRPGRCARQSLAHTRGAHRAPAAAQAGRAAGSSHPAPHPTGSSVHLHTWAGCAVSPHPSRVPARHCASSQTDRGMHRAPRHRQAEKPHLGALGLSPALLSHTR